MLKSRRDSARGDKGDRTTRVRVKVVDVVLDGAVQTISGLQGYASIRGLVWLHGAPLGYIEAPVLRGECRADVLRAAIVRDLGPSIARHLVADMLATSGGDAGYQVDRLINASHPEELVVFPLVTVAVCTRDRGADLAICLEALLQLDYPNLDLLVVDNAPSTDATERLVRDNYPQVRYVLEPRPGLDWARNRAIVEARGEIVAYTDDDCVVHPRWASAIATALQQPGVGAVTGLVVPYELETEAQQLFERYGGFGRGFERKWFANDANVANRPVSFLGAGQFGTGANMAFRRDIFDEIGGFDPALDVGTVTNGGGDLEMFFRVLKEGYTLAYEPQAVIRHRHRREYSRLRSQIANNGIGFYSHLVRSAMAYRDERGDALRLGVWWFWWWNVRRWLHSLWSPGQLPRELLTGELRGSITGLRRYQQARKTARALARDVATFGPVPDIATPLTPHRKRRKRPAHPPIAVRTVDVNAPLLDVSDVTDYAATRLVVTRDDEPIGEALVINNYQPISALRLRETIAGTLGVWVIDEDPSVLEGIVPVVARSVVDASAPITSASRLTPLPDDVPVSIVVATFDRPDDLRKCLHCLVRQDTRRSVEIIVVDNHPVSGLTPPVVAEFPDVLLVSEPRQGLSYARNRGFAASTGDVVVATDDDVTMQKDWLERLLAPFAQPSVMVVTGNTLPVELETEAQRRFEEYGGLGRGYHRKVAGREWFNRYRKRAVPTWELGATANAAFRASIFADPDIGMLDEALGAGTPTGCSEDTYLFYKVLKAGFDIVYEPTAYVWHRHRRDDRSLRRQIYNYSKGHVAYHLLTLTNDHDLRGLTDMFVRLPRWRVHQMSALARRKVKGRRTYPLSLIIAETAGNLAGPFALWRSRRRVAALGRSEPYVPPALRSEAQPESLERDEMLVAS
jgi:glycosyltransferase involved in cell wall biosynthesis